MDSQHGPKLELVLGGFWRRLGGVLGRFGVVLGPSWGDLGRFGRIFFGLRCDFGWFWMDWMDF